MRVRVNLLDDQWNVLETVETDEHRCAPELGPCRGTAACEGCGATGDQRLILIIPGNRFVCYPCLDQRLTDDLEMWADPSRCSNPWHKTNPTAALRPCPECPERYPDEDAPCPCCSGGEHVA